MASDDDLRAKLTKALAQQAYYRYPGDQIDALMPVVVGALAQAWDDGYWATDEDSVRDNPWREGD